MTVKREATWVAFGSLAYTIMFSYPVLRRIGARGFAHDWDFAAELEWIPYYTIAHFHRFPLWDPYKCGGTPMFGNPLSRILTPFLLLDLMAGPVAGLNLQIVLHLAIAFCGGYVLGRTMALRPIAALVTAVIFPSSSWYYLHLAEGHTVFLCAAYIPWIAASF